MGVFGDSPLTGSIPVAGMLKPLCLQGFFIFVLYFVLHDALKVFIREGVHLVLVIIQGVPVDLQKPVRGPARAL